MHDLQLVGFTTDRRGLIFRPRAAARSEASFVVPVTDELVELVAQLAEERAGQDASAAEVVDHADEAAAPSGEAAARPRSHLSVRDIQARLRAGEPVARVAAEAGVDEDWIERFAPPVRAEQRRIVDRALEHHLQRSRSAESAVPLRRAVGMALADKGIAYTVAAFDAAWSAHLLGHDRWAVEFTYRHRGRDRTATWTYDVDADVLTTGDRTAAQLGYVAPGAAGDDDGEAIDGIIGDPDATNQIGTASANTRSRRSSASASPARSRKSAKRAAATEGDPPSSGGGARTRRPAARKAASKKAASKRPAAKKSAPKKSAPKKSAPKKAAAKKAASKKAASKRPAAKKSAAKKSVQKKGASKRSAAKKSAAKKSAAKKSAAKRAVSKKAVSKKAVSKRSAVKKAAPEKAATGTPGAETARPEGSAASTSAPARSAATGPAVEQSVQERPPTNRSPASPVPTPAPGPASPAADDGAPTERPAATGRAVSGPSAGGSDARLPDEPARPALGPDTPAERDGHRRPGARPVAGRPGEIPIADVPLAGRPPSPRANGRPTDDGDEPDGRAVADPLTARRARAAERNAPTVQFRSGSAAPVRAAGEGDGRLGPGAGPAGHVDRSGTDPAASDGAAHPAARRRRQLRAR